MATFENNRESDLPSQWLGVSAGEGALSVGRASSVHGKDDEEIQVENDAEPHGVLRGTSSSITPWKMFPVQIAYTMHGCGCCFLDEGASAARGSCS